jgi:geranylgeranylglycerol-phosphate geranylgeranyltransferase
MMTSQPFLARLRRAVRGPYFLGHPLPTFLTAVAATAFFFMARGAITASVGAGLLFISVYLVLYSIGAMNDYVDEPLDRLAARREKPLVARDVSRSAALLIWVLTALLGFAASYPFNGWAVAIAIVLWLLGFSYNFWAKRTRFSWLPFAGFYPSLPLWGFVAAEKFTPTLLLTYPVSALLAVGLNVANTLPDLDRDLAGGVKGFTHRLGTGRALILLWLLFAATMVLMASAGLLIGSHLRRLVPGLLAGACLLGAMMADWGLLRSAASLRRTFYLSAASALVLGCAWVVSLP